MALDLHCLWVDTSVEFNGVKSVFASSVDYQKWLQRQSVSLLFETLDNFFFGTTLCDSLWFPPFLRRPLKCGRFHLFIYFLLFLVTKWIRTLRKLLALARIHLMYAQCRKCVCNCVSLAEFNLIGLNSHADSFMFTTRLMLDGIL